jgi:biopolymer transport protein ExbB
MELFDFVKKGGILMIPILALSVIAATVFFERLWALQRRKVVPPGFCRALISLLRQRKISEAETLCNQSDTVIAAVALTGLKHTGRARGLIKETMEETGQRAISELERFTGAVATVATVAPLLGLLGTVTGMIKVFRDISEQSNPEIGALAGGIWEALITTAAGLTVAIPAYAMHRYLMGRIDRLATEVAEQALEIIDLIEADAAVGAGSAEAQGAA